MTNKMKKSLKIIYSAFVAFLVMIALLLIFSILPITGNFKILTVISGSMEPSIKTGSVVFVKPSADYKIGDVITFGIISKTQVPTTHRIYDIKIVGGQPVYITKGDANPTPDTKETLKKDIVGKVLLDIPYLGYAVNFAKKPYGFAVIIIVPALAIIGDEVKKIIVEIRRKKNETKS